MWAPLAKPVGGGNLREAAEGAGSLVTEGLPWDMPVSFIVGVGRCLAGAGAELCGAGHADMRATVRAVTPEEFEAWAARAEHLLSPRELSFVREQVRTLDELGPRVRVPCHHDYSPRNWLVDAGRVGVIDFDLARWEDWVNDLWRLRFGVWWDRPDLQAAFLDGYGRELDGDDVEVLRRCGALAAVATVAWAHENDDRAFERAGRENLTRLMAGS
jgi:hypothetical protein